MKNHRTFSFISLRLKLKKSKVSDCLFD
ncbi:hypothetical protein HAINFHK1212_0890, partial [Haemophilus influenzae HK1212]